MTSSKIIAKAIVSTRRPFDGWPYTTLLDILRMVGEFSSCNQVVCFQMDSELAGGKPTAASLLKIPIPHWSWPLTSLPKNPKKEGKGKKKEKKRGRHPPFLQVLTVC